VLIRGAGFCTLELTVRPATLDGVDGPDFYFLVFTLRSHMCSEKPLLWWLLETHVAFRRLGEGRAASTQLYATD